MARRLGSKATLRAAATYAAADTWYAVTNEMILPGTGNAIEVFCTTAVGSCGQVDFYAEIVDDGTNAFQYDVGADSPQILGSVTTSAAGQLRTTVLPVPYPGSTVQLYFRCSAGAGASTLAILGCPVEDDAGGVEVSIGDLEVGVETIDTVAAPTEGTIVEVAFDGSVASGAALTAGIHRLTATEDCYYVFGAAPTADANDYYLPAGVDRFVTAPAEKIAAIKKAVAGSLFVVPVS